MRVSYYIVYDPQKQLGEKALRIYTFKTRRYVETTDYWLAEIGLGLTLWTGEFEGRNDTWVRWCDQDGHVLMTGDERAAQEKQRAENAEQRAELLAERLRALGVDPDSI